MSSDNVHLLSYTTAITAGSTVTTEKVILGQYISLNIIPKCDQDLTLVVQFSGDGVNWDYNQFNSIAAASNTLISSPVSGKWIRLQITNASVNNATYTRVYVYGAVSNSAITANISKVGNLWPTVELGQSVSRNAYNAIDVSQVGSFVNYEFYEGTSGDIASGFWSLPYDDIHLYYNGSVATLSVTSSYLYFIGATDLATDKTLMMGRKAISFKPSTSITCIFSGFYLQASKEVANPKATTELIGMGNVTTYPNIRDFVGFGYTNDYDYTDPDAFGLVIYKDGARVLFISRAAWNRDRADGTNVLPYIDPQYMNSYKINIGNGVLSAYILDPNTGIYEIVHRFAYGNTSTSTAFHEPNFGFMTYIASEIGSVPVSSGSTTAIQSFKIFNSDYQLDERSAVIHEETYIGLTSYDIIVGFCTNDPWITKVINMCARLQYISYVVDGGVGALIKIHVCRNSNVTAASHTPIEKARCVVATLDSPTLVSGGEVLFSKVVPGNTSGFIDLREYNILLYPKQGLDYDISNIAIIASSTASVTLDISASWINY